MKRILVRAGMSPIIDKGIGEIINFNRIGDNVGNLVYLYSVFRALAVNEEVEIVPTNYLVSRLNVDEVNETFDCFVIPLADAIRNSFVDEMKRLTDLINKLTIPCYVLGIGLRAPHDYQSWGIAFDHDEVAYNFFKAVLNKSAMVGVRGEITADYLKKIGFIPEKDFSVIGCPSFYTYGENLSVRPLNLNSDSRIAINNSVMTKKNVQDFLQGITNEYSNHYFFPQRVNEMNMMYMGYDYHFIRSCEGYPGTVHHPLYQNDRVRIHTNIYSWMNDLKGMDFSIGPRLHGNVAALLAGTPSLWIVHDARMIELSDYHKLPNLFANDIAEDFRLQDVLDKVDYQAFYSRHKENFWHYVDFLDKLGLEHIYRSFDASSKVPLDIKAEKLGFTTKNASLKSILDCDRDEIILRINEYIDTNKARRAEDDEVVRGNSAKLRNQIKGLEKELKSRDKKLGKKTKELDEIQEKLTATKLELTTVKAELREAKRSLWYIIKRKIRRLLSFFKKKNE